VVFSNSWKKTARPVNLVGYPTRAHKSTKKQEDLETVMARNHHGQLKKHMFHNPGSPRPNKEWSLGWSM